MNLDDAQSFRRYELLTSAYVCGNLSAAYRSEFEFSLKNNTDLQSLVESKKNEKEFIAELIPSFELNSKTRYKLKQIMSAAEDNLIPTSSSKNILKKFLSVINR